jgi:hypothetical protein
MQILRTAGHSIHNSVHIGQYICYAQCMNINLLLIAVIICCRVLLSFDELSSAYYIQYVVVLLPRLS